MATPITPEFVRVRDVLRLTGLSRASVYRLAAAGGFPRPVKLSERSSAWVRCEVEAWVRERIAARDRQREAA